ncbi:MAG: cytochrome c3 family protein [Candidatus Aminicenantes bacterium]|nr:cytochrome c3 family protein [Candidatus Aminicenantes bacterium]
MVKTKKRKKRLIIFFSLLAFIVVVLLGSIEFTSHSQFCSTCHYMKPFFKSWEESSHSDFECSVCHYPPGGGIKSKLRKKIEGLVMVGRYWTKLYVKSKPWAEIRDESCLREGCHEKRLLEGQVQFNKVTFDHKIHFADLKRGKQLQCTSCHSQIVQGEHITVTESSCFICHFKKSEHYPQIDDCNHCHTKETLIGERSLRYNHTLVFDNGFSCDKCHSNTVVGDGEVPRENCYKCHWEQERLEKYDDTDLMHTRHIHESKIECNQCHMEIQHKIVKDIEAIADCRSCHTDFHKAQKILYTGEGGRGISHPMPNIMLEKGLSCKGCHIFHEGKGGRLIESDTYFSEAEACESCHGQGFSRILKDWEISTTKKLRQIKSIYSRVNQEINRTKHSSQNKAKDLLEDVLFNIEIVDKGKSVHNISFSQELLQVAYKKMLNALEVIGSNYKPETFQGASDEIPTQCSNCHAGIEEISAEIFGLNFPHKKHLIEQEIDCSTCHSNVREHGEFIATKHSCATCHHKDTDKNCGSCHQLQTVFYQGGKMNGQEIPKDIMAEAEVECLDCHLGDNKQIFRSDKAKCAECHDEDYSEIYSEWQTSIKELILSLSTSLKQKRKLELSEQERSSLHEIEEFLQKISSDGSMGIHNFIFYEEILTNFDKRIKSIGKIN